MVIKRIGIREGTLQSAVVFPMRKGEESLYEQRLYSRRRTRRKRKKQTQGERIVAVLPGQPNLVVLNDKRGVQGLAQPISGPKRLTLKKRFHLKNYKQAGWSAFSRRGRCLVATTSRTVVEAFDVGKRRIKRVLQQNLVDHQVGYIRDLEYFGPEDQACLP